MGSGEKYLIMMRRGENRKVGDIGGPTGRPPRAVRMSRGGIWAAEPPGGSHGPGDEGETSTAGGFFLIRVGEHTLQHPYGRAEKREGEASPKNANRRERGGLQFVKKYGAPNNAEEVSK